LLQRGQITTGVVYLSLSLIEFLEFGEMFRGWLGCGLLGRIVRVGRKRSVLIGKRTYVPDLAGFMRCKPVLMYSRVA